MSVLCEAAAMDAAADPGGPAFVDPCDEIASVECHGYSLCSGCADALLTLVSLGAAARRARKQSLGGEA